MVYEKKKRTNRYIRDKKNDHSGIFWIILTRVITEIRTLIKRYVKKNQSYAIQPNESSVNNNTATITRFYYKCSNIPWKHFTEDVILRHSFLLKPLLFKFIGTSRQYKHNLLLMRKMYFTKLLYSEGLFLLFIGPFHYYLNSCWRLINLIYYVNVLSHNY